MRNPLPVIQISLAQPKFKNYENYFSVHLIFVVIRIFSWDMPLKKQGKCLDTVFFLDGFDNIGGFKFDRNMNFY